MESRARIGNHPLHPMLIVVPAGSFVVALVLDVVYLLTGGTLWWAATLPVMLIGVIGGLLAAIPGLVDLVAISKKQNARGIALTHMAINLVVVALFAWNAWTRWTSVEPPAPEGTYAGFWLTLIAVGGLGVSGWLGWKMVYEYHMAVLEHPDAKDPEPRIRREAAD